MIPRDLLEEVDQVEGKRARSLLIAEAAREKLEKERFVKILDIVQGAWSDRNHPELKTARDMERFIREKKQSYRCTMHFV